MIRIIESSRINTSTTREALSRVPDHLLPLVIDNFVRSSEVTDDINENVESISYNLAEALKSDRIPKDVRRAIASRIVEHYERFGEYQSDELAKKNPYRDAKRKNMASSCRYYLIELIVSEKELDPILRGHAVDLIARSSSFSNYQLMKLSEVTTLSEDERSIIQRKLTESK